MLSDVQNAMQAEAELNEMNPGVEAPVESPETVEQVSQVESDQEGVESETVDTTEKNEEVELPEDHDPNAVLVDEAKEEEDKVPQHRTDAKNLAEKWDMLSDDEQSEKIERLRKSGRKQTINALAAELGTTTKNLLNPDDTIAEKENEVEALKSKLAELEGVMSYATKQAEQDRFVTQMQKWTQHNKLGAEATKELLKTDGDLRKTFDELKFDPKTGEKLTLNGRLRIALNQTESVQEMLVNRKAKATAEGIAEGYKAALPGAAPTASSVPQKREEEMSAEEWLSYSNASMGGRSWN